MYITDIDAYNKNRAMKMMGLFETHDYLLGSCNAIFYVYWWGQPIWPCRKPIRKNK